MSSRVRIRQWIHRYGVAEVAGTSAAILASLTARALTGNDVAAGYAGAVAENLGYYGVIVGREVRADARLAREASRGYGLRGAFRTGRNLVFEFGFAELLDTGAVRPLAMAMGVHYLGGGLGTVAGKLVADLAFYVPVIIAHELRRYFARLGPRAACDD
jgi:hypothetical protein